MGKVPVKVVEKKSNLIVFHRPTVMAKKQVEPEPKMVRYPAAKLLKELDPNDISVVLVITKDNTGTLGLVSNALGPNETLMLLKSTEFQMLNHLLSNEGDNNGNTFA